MTDEAIRKAYKRYRIPNGLRYILPGPGDAPNNPPTGYVTISEYILQCGVKVPFHPFIERLLKYYGLVPF